MTEIKCIYIRAIKCNNITSKNSIDTTAIKCIDMTEKMYGYDSNKTY